MSSRPIAAVLLRDEARALALVRYLDSEGIETKVTCSTDQFYDLLNREGADLVLVEHRLRGFLTGLEILERLYDDLLRPPTMLIADLNPQEDRRAKRLGIDAVVEAQTPLDELAQTALNVVTHSRNAYLPVSLEARQLVQNADCIRPLPQLLLRMCSYLNEERTRWIAWLAISRSIPRPRPNCSNWPIAAPWAAPIAPPMCRVPSNTWACVRRHR